MFLFHSQQVLLKDLVGSMRSIFRVHCGADLPACRPRLSFTFIVRLDEITVPEEEFHIKK
jgi:hypothetical protein